MKKTILTLSLTLGSTLCFADTGEKCANYIERKAGTTTTYNGTSVGILTADQAVKTGISVAIETTESLSPVGKIFPFASIALRGFTPTAVEGPDEDLVGCLDEFDGRIETLEYYSLAQDASDALSGVLDDTIQGEIHDQNNHYAHKEAYEKYDTISNDIASTLSYFLVSDDEPTGSKYRAIQNDTLLFLLTAELSAFAHNFEFNAYCAEEYGYRWSETALDLLEFNNVSGNFAMMDYNAHLAATYAEYDDDDVFEYNEEKAGCELGRDIYSRFRTLRTSSGTLISEAFSNLGLTVSLDDDANKLSVSVDIDASKLLDYRLELIGSCSTGSRGGVWDSDNLKLGVRVWAEAEDYAPLESTTFWKSEVVATGRKNDGLDDMLEYCNSWRTGRINTATGEVEEILYGIKDTLESMVIYDYMRPANELAGRELSFDTYTYDEINDDLLRDYILKPVFALDDDGNILDDFNHYQISIGSADKYLKTRPNEGVFTTNNGAGVDSHWQVSEIWPGTNLKIKSVYTDECLFDDNGSLNTETCSDSSYSWYSENTTGDAKHALVYLHAAEDTDKCLIIGDETLSEYSNSNKVVAEDCDEHNANQRFILGDSNSLQVNEVCLDVPRSESFSGQSLIVYSCHYGSNQQWIMNDDGTIQSSLVSTEDGSDLCLQAGASGSDIVDITLEVCDATEPKQKMVRRSITTDEVSAGATDAIIENIDNGHCIGDCETTFDITEADLDSDAVNITRVSDSYNLKHKDGSDPYIADGVGSWGTWYLDDSDANGVYALRSYATGECLVMDDDTMTSETCSTDSEKFYFH